MGSHINQFQAYWITKEKCAYIMTCIKDQRINIINKQSTKNWTWPWCIIRTHILICDNCRYNIIWTITINCTGIKTHKNAVKMPKSGNHQERNLKMAEFVQHGHTRTHMDRGLTAVDSSPLRCGPWKDIPGLLDQAIELWIILRPLLNKRDALKWHTMEHHIYKWLQRSALLQLARSEHLF